MAVASGAILMLALIWPEGGTPFVLLRLLWGYFCLSGFLLASLLEPVTKSSPIDQSYFLLLEDAAAPWTGVVVFYVVVSAIAGRHSILRSERIISAGIGLFSVIFLIRHADANGIIQIPYFLWAAAVLVACVTMWSWTVLPNSLEPTATAPPVLTKP